MVDQFVTVTALEERLKIEREATKILIGDLRDEMVETRRDAALAAAGYSLVKEQIKESFDGLARAHNDHFDELKTMIKKHDAPIARLRAYETLAVGGVNLAIPAFKAFKKIASVVLVGAAGGGMGLILFGMITR